MQRLTRLLIVWIAGTLCLHAQQSEPTIQSEDRQIRLNPRYSVAVLMQKTPEEDLANAEADLQLSASSRYAELVHFLKLPIAARRALEAGQNEKAKSYAEEALTYIANHPKLRPASTGQVAFDCNLVLGRLSLLHDDIPQAESYLLLSGTTFGSPALDTFGPNMSLARELLKRSRSEAVLKYFEQCKAFWHTEDEKGRLDHWSAEVQAGRIPVFGMNLFY